MPCTCLNNSPLVYILYVACFASLDIHLSFECLCYVADMASGSDSTVVSVLGLILNFFIFNNINILNCLETDGFGYTFVYYNV